MATPRALRLSILALLCLVVVPAPNAVAARRGAARPTITSIGPASVAVGDTLTIRGRGFLPGRARNTVSFTRAGKPAVAVKAGDATRTRLRVVVPRALSRYLSDTQPTRFRVRVRARRSSKVSTARRLSVLVSSPAALELLEDGGADGCTPAALPGDVAGALDDALATDLGDVLDDVLPDDGGCDATSAGGDDPAAADDGADPADDGTGADDPLGAEDPVSG
jgi:hypothetical protein